MNGRIVLQMALMVMLSGSPVIGQTTTVPEVLKLKQQWKKFADEGRKLNFEGRFNGRTGDSFRVEKLEVEFRLPGSIRLPDRMRERQRMDITGKFAVNGQRITFLVSELTIRETDLERLANRVEALPGGQPDELLALADEFAEIAEFYGDESLSSELEDIRLSSVQSMRQMASGDVPQLAKVVAVAKAQQVNNSFLQAIGYEILLTKWKARADGSELVKSVQQLSGWDKPEMEVPDQLKQGFPRDAIRLYNEGNVRDREILHRLLYRTVRGEQIQFMVKPDGSNGLELAGLVRDELPEEVVMAAGLEQREVDYRLGRISELSRREMQQLLELLNGLKRSDGQDAIIADWLVAQEKRFGTSELAGVLRVADEYLFVFEQWKNVAHQQKGIDLLKSAWAIAAVESPGDAVQIAERLKVLGWEQLNGKWLTTQQMETLPKDDIQIAIRDGRVVKGMTAQQVVQTLGQPERVSRFGSAKVMREMWTYDGTGSAGLVVRLRKSLLSRADQLVVEDVSRTSALIAP
ncbi:MAG: hypothetical protein U0936_23175 [Planctomycetaceae bacterium]